MVNMKNLKDIILEKLRVSKNYISKPELIGRNIVSCTMEFFFKWIMVLDPNKPLTQADFEDFEVVVIPVEPRFLSKIGRYDHRRFVF